MLGLYLFSRSEAHLLSQDEMSIFTIQIKTRTEKGCRPGVLNAPWGGRREAASKTGSHFKPSCVKVRFVRKSQEPPVHHLFPHGPSSAISDVSATKMFRPRQPGWALAPSPPA